MAGKPTAAGDEARPEEGAGAGADEDGPNDADADERGREAAAAPSPGSDSGSRAGDDLRDRVLSRVASMSDGPLTTAMARAQLPELMEAFTPPGLALHLIPDESWVDPSFGRVRLSGVIADDKRRVPVAVIQRSLAIGEKLADHEYLQVEAPFRGRGIAIVLTLQAFELYDRLGLDGVAIHASLGSGRWYWAGRVGFDFLDDEQRSNVERWARHVIEVLGLDVDLEGVVEARQWALLGTDEDPPVTRSLAQLAGAARTCPVDLLDPNATGMAGVRPVVHADPSGTGVVDAGEHVAAIAQLNSLSLDKQLELGRLILLSGPDWYGIFDLHDAPRRAAYAQEMRAQLRRIAQLAATESASS